MILHNTIIDVMNSDSECKHTPQSIGNLTDIHTKIMEIYIDEIVSQVKEKEK